MTDLVEKLTIWPAADGADALAGHFVEALMQEAAAEITKLRAERDAAVLTERERCKKSVRNTICNMSWPPEDGDQLIDDLQMGIALLATERADD